MNGGIGSSTCREFVVGGFRFFGGMFLLGGLVPIGISAFVIIDYIRSVLDADHSAFKLVLGDTPATVTNFVLALTAFGACLLADGAFMIRFSMSKLMDKLDNQHTDW